MQKKIVIIGAGTYGSYLANSIIEKHPEFRIHLFDVGNNKIQTEEQIGYLSIVKNGNYKATSDGRFFCLGGTSRKWGGQLFFYSANDFANEQLMSEVVDANLKYSSKVLSRFFTQIPKLKENIFNSKLFVKHGVWLKYSQRNLFRYFNLNRKKNIVVYKNCRIIHLNLADNRITSITVLNTINNEISDINADIFYLVAGAFESLRLMHVSKLTNIEESSFGFSDHISMQCFKFENKKSKIGETEFQFKFINGSMITTRLVGEIDGVSFYIHPIFNKEFYFFQLIKEILFKGKISISTLRLALKQGFLFIPFLYYILIKKQLFIYGHWYLNIDMELSESSNVVKVSKNLDKTQQPGIEISYTISDDTLIKLKSIKKELEKILKDNKIDYEDVLNIGATSLKLEDIYHPYNLFKHNDNQGLYNLINPVDNLFVFNTGLLKRAGGINPSATIFCLIEKHINEYIIK